MMIYLFLSLENLKKFSSYMKLGVQVPQNCNFILHLGQVINSIPPIKPANKSKIYHIIF